MSSIRNSLRSAELFLIGLAVILGWLTFGVLRPAIGFQDPPAARIVVLHMPMAWLCTVWFIVSAVYAVLYLRRRQFMDDDASSAAAGIGLLCCALATATGSIFAHTQWGSWWNWDPRETSIFFLLLVYGAYFSLRGSVEDPTRRALFSAVYAVMACVVMPFLVFVLPRLYPSLHPSRAHLEGSYWLVIVAGLIGFSIFLTWVFRIRLAIGRAQLHPEITPQDEDIEILRPTLVQPDGRDTGRDDLSLPGRNRG